MMLERLAKALGVGAILIAATLFATAANALPLPQAGVATPAAVEAAAPVELAHGCHPNIQRDYSGWHFHTRACVRRNTAPPGLHHYYANRRYYRTPVCTYRCRFVGPLKTCSQVCR